MPSKYFPGWVGGWGKIENKDHLSPTETEIGAELGNTEKDFTLLAGASASRFSMMVVCLLTNVKKLKKLRTGV